MSEPVWWTGALICAGCYHLGHGPHDCQGTVLRREARFACRCAVYRECAGWEDPAKPGPTIYGGPLDLMLAAR